MGRKSSLDYDHSHFLGKAAFYKIGQSRRHLEAAIFPGRISPRIRSLRWVIPLLTAALVTAYEIGPARWIHSVVGEQYYFLAEILVYGTLGPLLAFFLLDFISRWNEERETSELQAKVLDQIREHANISRRLSDDALQTLFAASILITHLKETLPEGHPEAADYLSEMERSIDQNIEQLRSHLLTLPKNSGTQTKTVQAAGPRLASASRDL